MVYAEWVSKEMRNCHNNADKWDISVYEKMDKILHSVAAGKAWGRLRKRLESEAEVYSLIEKIMERTSFSLPEYYKMTKAQRGKQLDKMQKALTELNKAYKELGFNFNWDEFSGKIDIKHSKPNRYEFPWGREFDFDVFFEALEESIAEKRKIPEHLPRPTQGLDQAWCANIIACHFESVFGDSLWNNVTDISNALFDATLDQKVVEDQVKKLRDRLPRGQLPFRNHLTMGWN